MYFQGWVPKPELSTEQIEFPQKVFYRGQVVKCQVLAVHPEQEKMVLSFKVMIENKLYSVVGVRPQEFAEDWCISIEF